jgi:hypothetical protein
MNNVGTRLASASVFWFALFAGVSVSAQTRPFDGGEFKGRIAYSADGNHNDPDDWSASPVALAIIAEAGLRDRLVHFDYNSILPLTDPEWERIHAESVLGAARLYRFDLTRFFDDRSNLDGAIASIVNAINASSADNPLYFIIAGPMEVPYRAMRMADPEKLQYVFCISHSRWNDGFAQDYTFTFTKRTIIEQDIHWVQIQDQNRRLSYGQYGSPATAPEFAPYFWMRDSHDPNVKFLWERMVVSTRPDPSDAGMAWFLVSGDEECTPEKLQSLLENRRPLSRTSVRDRVRIEAENFRHLEGFMVQDRQDRLASHRLEIHLPDADTGRIITRFNEPFASDVGRYDVEVRTLDRKDATSRFALFVNGTPRGSAWSSGGTGKGWTSHVIPNVEVKLGDEIRVEAEGRGSTIDFVQFSRRAAVATPAAGVITACGGPGRCRAYHRSKLRDQG